MSDKEELISELKFLINGYINLLITGYERIIELGGECDSIETMIRGDHHLNSAYKLIKKMESVDERV